MDCRQAQAVLSALHDGEPISQDDLAGAHAHCPTCIECTAFRDALALLDSSPAPLSPPGLTERVMAGVDAAAAQDASDRADRSILAETSPTASTVGGPAWAPVWLTRKRLWAGTAAVVAAAAVVSAIALASTGALQMFSSEGREALTLRPDIPVAAAPTESTGASQPLAGAADTTKATATPLAYISFDARVYGPGPTLGSAVSNLTTIGVTSSAFDQPGPPAQVPVYRSSLSDGSIVVRTPSGLQQFAAVVRTLGGKTYQLSTGAPISRYGEWPTLPASYPQPTQPDGSPTFRQSGADATGVTAYTPPGATPTNGFAIAPGTPASDPAAGNPNWTWWSPLVVP